MPSTVKLAAVGRHQPGRQPDQRRFAGAIGADQRGERSLGDGDRNTVECSARFRRCRGETSLRNSRADRTGGLSTVGTSWSCHVRCAVPGLFAPRSLRRSPRFFNDKRTVAGSPRRRSLSGSFTNTRIS